jgi:phosphoglycolate phosphatase-like HAD superfamily hydrolase
MIKAVIFDFDGTLVDTAKDLIDTANIIFVKYDKSQISLKEGYVVASNGIHAFLNKRFSSSEIEKLDLVSQFKLIYQDCCNKSTNLFIGYDELLDELYNSKVLLGIATNKPRLFTDKIVDSLKIRHFFKFIYCPDDGFKPKPSSHMLDNAIKELNINSNEILYVGDAERDIISSNKANIGSVLASYGYIDPDENTETWGHDYLIHSANDLKRLLYNFSF